MRQCTALLILVVSCGPGTSSKEVQSPGGDDVVFSDSGPRGKSSSERDAPLLIVSHNDELRVLEPGGELLARLPVVEVQSAVAVSPDGTLIAAGRSFAPSENGWTEDGTVWLWRFDERFDGGAVVRADHMLTAHRREMVVALAFTADSRWMLSAGDRGRMILWDVGSRKPEHQWRVPYATAASISPDGQWVLTHHLDGVRLWTRQGKGRKLDLPNNCMDSSFAIDSNRFAVICKNAVFEFEPPDLQAVRELETELAYGRGISYSRNLLAALYREKDVIVWNREGGDVAMTIQAGDESADEAYRLVLDPTGRVLGVGYCNEIRVFDLVARERLYSVTLPQAERCRPALAFIRR